MTDFAKYNARDSRTLQPGVFLSKSQVDAFAELVRLDERERIIKLLEQELWVLPDGTLAAGEIYMPLKNAIALIKGENK